ncbi:wax ester/triacylglycerol synthase family O-acyltransferase [Streptomyces roseoverticillatus]|uniref:wax ester/triacylglycerol synthase family O-acyltransferase n=1 Tax=Streptomyces roseoverticillatus TaxID=66429 RepID=UPI001F1E8BC9|nr:wax ester/triacylglycerol synthase family O-acyltransferase [Streptomyces roseoverticillatus]MCF3105777.1 wax ester/triacylglycerol synthase family O-acyltransferase [Streptomyces roseoverticillatus]
MAPELLTPLDLAFWNIESSGHPLHMGGLFVFDAGTPDAAERAAGLLVARAARIPGLNTRIRPVLFPLGSAARHVAPDYDPLDHVHLTEPVRDFHAAAGVLMQQPLERGRPPWAAHVLPGAEGTSFAVLFTFHHAHADGMRAASYVLSLLDSATVDAAPAPVGVPQPRETGSSLRLPDPRKLPGLVRDAGRAVSISSAMARAAWGVSSSPALISRATGARRADGAVVGLREVNRIREATGGTVNDVLLAVVAGGLRRWLDKRGDGSDGVQPRALVPVSLRDPGDASASGNRLSGYLTRLPVDKAEPLARLRAVHEAMERNKQAGPASGPGAAALLADAIPPLGHRFGGGLIARSGRLFYDLLISSVPLRGADGLRLAGSPVREAYPLAPLAPGQSLAVGITTYEDRVCYGLLADAVAVPDLDVLARSITEEVAELVAVCGP